MYKSQWGQDRILNGNIFKDKQNGFFVDVGAHNGISGSNSYFYEKLGWKGICIEPIPEIYQKLIKNRDCICLEGCAYNRSGTVKFNRLSGYTEMLSGIEEAYPEQHKKRIANEIAAMSGSRESLDVKCYRLADILAERDISHVDYLSIDTEGSELQILQGIEFDKVTFDAIDVEVNYESEAGPIYELLDKVGYQFWQKIGGDVVFIPKSTL